MLVINENKLKTLPPSLQKQVRRVAVSEISREKKSVTPPLSLEEYTRLVRGAPIKSSQNKQLSGFPENILPQDMGSFVKKYWPYLAGGGILLFLFFLQR